MGPITIREVQHNLSAYLRRVERGEEIVIRRRHVVIARLVPAKKATDSEHLDWAIVRERRRVLWGGEKAPGKPISEIVYESRGD